MLRGLVGKKLGMTNFFTEDGDRVAVTVVQAGPVTVVQKKTMASDNYEAAQVGFEEIKKDSKLKNVSKPLKGHFKEARPTRYLREVKVEDIDAIEVGQTYDVGIFETGDIVDVSGISKGKGTSGVIKRHNFSGGPASHGHRFNRGTGAIGQSATPARVFKGKKMPGRLGNARVTIHGLQIMNINPDLNVLLIKGSIPGPNGRLVEVRKTVKNVK